MERDITCIFPRRFSVFFVFFFYGLVIPTSHDVFLMQSFLSTCRRQRQTFDMLFRCQNKKFAALFYHGYLFSMTDLLDDEL